VREAGAHLHDNGGGTHDVHTSPAAHAHLDIGVNPPDHVALHAAHGGLRDRVFLTDRLALRLEARAYYAPKSCCLSSTWVGHVLGSAGLSFFIGGGGPHEELPPPIPKPKRDSIIAAGGKPPEPPRPT